MTKTGRSVGLLIAAMAIACVPKQTTPETPKAPALTSGALRLFSHTGIAHGCPVGETELLTARHVATVTRPSGEITPAFVIWSDAEGHTGSAWTDDYDIRRDLATMRSDQPFPRFYPVAREAPAIHERVTITGYDFRADRPLKPLVITTEVINVVSAHLVLESSAAGGFSGSCVLNARGETVGVFQWSVEREMRRFGIASGVWGDWRSVGWLPLPRQP